MSRLLWEKPVAKVDEACLNGIIQRVGTGRPLWRSWPWREQSSILQSPKQIGQVRMFGSVYKWLELSGRAGWRAQLGVVLVVIALAAAGLALSRRKPAIAPLIISVEATTTSFGDAGHLVNGTSMIDFWESEPAAGVALQVSLKEVAQVSGYRLQTGPHMPEAGLRMPKAWELSASVDGGNWVVIDRRSEDKPWGAEEVREYRLDRPVEAGNLKFDLRASYAGDAIRIYRLAVE